MKEERKLLTDMARRNGGVLKVDDVLEEARREDSILHKHFEWDDTKAAANYRKEQARSLIQRCKITLVEGEPVSVRAFVSLPTDRESGGGYRLTSEVISNESQKGELLRDIQLTIARWSQKLHLLDQDIAELLEEVENRINSKTTQPQQAAA
jgi:hypothetical protein